MQNTPTLRYFVSDTYGSCIPDPTKADVDADVLLETDLSCIEGAMVYGDQEELVRLGAGYPVKINSQG